MPADAVPDPDLVGWGLILQHARRCLNAAGDRREGAEEPMTQQQLGERLDPAVGQGTVAKWELGLREPRRHYREQLADIAGMPGLFLGRPDPQVLTAIRTSGRRPEAVA